MKKRSMILAALCLTGAMMLTGCSGNNKGKEGESSTEAVSTGTENADDMLMYDKETDEAAVPDEEVEYDALEYVTLGEYKGLKLQYPTPTVADDDLEWYIQDLLDEHTEYNDITDRASQEGDCVNVDFVGTINGEEFEDGSYEEYDIIIGDGEFLEEFEKNLVGRNTGDEFSFPVTFPDDYYDEALAGQEAEFAVTINYISEVVVPEYNDAFVSEVSDCTTVAEFEEMAKKELMIEAEDSSKTTAKEDALSMVVENAKIDGFPQELYDRCYQETYESYQSYAEMFGMEFEEFLADFMGMTEEGIETEAVTYMNETMVVKAIAETEGIEVTDENYAADAEPLLEYYEYDTLEEFEADYGKSYIKNEILREKVTDFLYDSAEVEEVSEDEYYVEETEE